MAEDWIKNQTKQRILQSDAEIDQDRFSFTLIIKLISNEVASEYVGNCFSSVYL